MTNQIAELSYHDALERAGKNGTSISGEQAAHHVRALADEIAPPALEKIAIEREKLAKKQAELDSLEQEHLGRLEKWERLLVRREALITTIGTGGWQRASLEQSIAGCLVNLHALGWGQNQTMQPHGNPDTIAATYGAIVGAKAALEDFPNWLKSKTGELDAVNAEITAFARANGITDSLPSELKS